MHSWFIRNPKVDIKNMSESLRISIPTAHILANRGIKTKEDAFNFLYPNLKSLHDIRLMKDVDKGIYILVEAIQNKDKIMIYGDYDVDGVMSTVILYKMLKCLNANVDYYIPHRQHEGYGLNCEAIKKFKDKNISLILTCDNGIADIDEIYMANQQQMKVIVIDHHEQGITLPNADAVIDPKRKDCTYPFKLLCAAGICYKFAIQLYKTLNKEINSKEYLVLSAIATICDVVDLLGENRTIAKKGLEEIHNCNNIGLHTLISKSELSNKKISTYQIGFIIGPCINAAGRLDSARLAAELFITDNYNRATEIAIQLIELNKMRKKMTSESVKKLSDQVKNYPNDKVLVLYDSEIHESIAGIVAGRIKEAVHKPTIVLTKGEQFAKGSARSIKDYNMFAELYKHKKLFIKFGGHPMAAGLTIKTENIDQLRKLLNDNCTLTAENLTPKLYIDMRIPLQKINISLAEHLQMVEPFGKSNAEPLFAEKNIQIARLDFIGSSKEIIRFTIVDRNSYINAISFDGYNKFKELIKLNYEEYEYKKIMSGGYVNLKMDLLFTININEYNDRRDVQLVVKDFRI